MMKLEKTLGQDLPKAGTRNTNPRKITGELDFERDFETFDDFLAKYPLDEITIPVCVVPPDDEGDYWLIQVALSMKNKVIDCCVWHATTHEISRYRTKAFRQYKLAMGVNEQLIARKKKDE